MKQSSRQYLEKLEREIEFNRRLQGKAKEMYEALKEINALFPCKEITALLNSIEGSR